MNALLLSEYVSANTEVPAALAAWQREWRWVSARGYHRVLRVARTLADLDGEEPVRRVHFAEALAYRALADEIRRAA
jgi:predicted ATPase with chaperone activity